MIEMLGVLAIIGVLSIGGLAGYTMAMNRHRANTVLDYASRCAVVAQTYGDGSSLPTETNCKTILDNEDLPGGADSVRIEGTVDQPIIQIGTHLPQKLCEAIKDRGRGSNVISITNDTRFPGTDCQDSTPTLLIKYNPNYAS